MSVMRTFTLQSSIEMTKPKETNFTTEKTVVKFLYRFYQLKTVPKFTGGENLLVALVASDEDLCCDLAQRKHQFSEYRVRL